MTGEATLFGASSDLIAGRWVPRVYRVRREETHHYLRDVIEASGGSIIYESPNDRVPFYFGVQLATLERLGLLVYPITITKRATDGRKATESRGQLKYGNERTWREDHAVGRDLAGVDVTLMLGLDPERRLIVSLDPSLYDPMPLGISVIYLSDVEAEEIYDKGVVAKTRVNRPGSRNPNPRTPQGLETWVGCRPDRFLDVVRFERNSYILGLDQPLRFTALDGITQGPIAESPTTSRHDLEAAFDLSAAEILEVIRGRHRLEVAVRGGIAELHLERHLLSLPWLSRVSRLDKDGLADFDVTVADGRSRLIECKNVSPDVYASGEIKVETQKTRASKSDPASRFYPVTAFDVVAACLYSVTHRWEFRFARTAALDRHREFPDRLAVQHRLDERWTPDLRQVLPVESE